VPHQWALAAGWAPCSSARDGKKVHAGPIPADGGQPVAVELQNRRKGGAATCRIERKGRTTEIVQDRIGREGEELQAGRERGGRTGWVPHEKRGC
jgi:hypothetical protein